MRIGIDASRAFEKQRTGIEEYSYQVIKNLADKLENCQVVLYIKKNQNVEIALPKNWKTKVIKWPRFWTQIGLSLEMICHPVDVLFIPSHTVPLIHPKNTVVTIHGLEYEILPEAYSFWERLYMRLSIKNSCRWASHIIAVSKNTKKDLMELYDVPEDKIEVIYEGFGNVIANEVKQSRPNSTKDEIATSPAAPRNDKYVLFIGRLEERKNIIGIIQSFEILKEKYKIPHRLILAGKVGYGYENIKRKILESKYKKDIIETGYIAEEKKWNLFKSADVFLFPTFYEGFGLPILQSQAIGVPVVAGDNSSIPEIAGDSSVLVNPREPQEIADATFRLINDENFRNGIIKKGYINTKRFSWKKCAKQIARAILL